MVSRAPSLTGDWQSGEPLELGQSGGERLQRAEPTLCRAQPAKLGQVRLSHTDEQEVRYACHTQIGGRSGTPVTHI